MAQLKKIELFYKDETNIGLKRFDGTTESDRRKKASFKYFNIQNLGLILYFNMHNYTLMFWVHCITSLCGVSVCCKILKLILPVYNKDNYTVITR